MAEHEFWPDDLTMTQAIPSELPIVGHRQITDAYLLAMAGSHGGVVATLDRGLMSAAAGREELVDLVQGS